MSKEQAEVPEIFETFITETSEDGVVVASRGEHNKRKDPDWPQFEDQAEPETDEGEEDDELTADDVEEIDEDDDDDGTDDDNSDDDDDGADEPTDDATADDEDGEPDNPKPKKRKSAKARISEITAARRAAEERAQVAEAELAALKAAPAEADPEPEPAAADTDEPDLSDLKRPDPADEKYMFGEIDQLFLEDMAEYNAEKAFRKREHAAEKKRAAKEAEDAQTAEIARLEKNFVDNVVEPGKTKFDDFDDVVIEGGKAGNYQLTPTLVSLISESEHGAEIMYHYASNPEEASKVASQSVARQAAHFGALEARFSSEDAGEKKGKKTTPTKAPKPAKRKARGSGKGHRTNPATTDFAAFEKMVNS